MQKLKKYMHIDTDTKTLTNVNTRRDKNTRTHKHTRQYVILQKTFLTSYDLEKAIYLEIIFQICFRHVHMAK